MTKKIIYSVSFGKDSTAMLLLALEQGFQIDEIVFYDTGVEFPIIYKVRDYFLPMLKERGIKYVELKPKIPFFERMLNYEYKTRKGIDKKGYGWCGGICRWGTTEKINAIDKYCKGSIQIIGIAYDETKRLGRLINKKNKFSILAALGITEKEALQICYKHGINYDGIYEKLDRVSCWCCRNKNLKELAVYKKDFPELFNKLIELEKKIGEPMKQPHFLNERFSEE